MPMSPLERNLLFTLADNVPHRIYAKDTEGRFIFANRAVALGMGAGKPEALLGKTDFDFYPRQSAEQYFMEEQEIIRSSVPMVNREEHVFYVKSGTEAWMLTTKVPYRDEEGRIAGIVGINYDITALKANEGALRSAKVRAEEVAANETTRLYAELLEQHRNLQHVQAALRESESFLKAAQTISRTGAWRWRPDADEDIWSPEVFRMLGYDPLIDRPSYDSFLQRIHPDDLPAFQDNVGAALERRLAFDVEFRIVAPDGSTRCLQSMGEPVSARDYVGALIDLTDRKAADEEVRRMRSELERMSRVTTVGALAASIAHEITQPLMAISANGSASLRFLDQGADHEVRQALCEIVDDAMRAADVIRGLGRLMRKSAPEATPLDMRQIIQEVVALTRGQAQATGVSLEPLASFDATLVVGDRAQLQQVLLNLIINAIEAMGSMTGEKTVRLRTARSTNGNVQVEVQDNGPGVDASITQSLFEPFVTTKSSGMGMGLSICRSIVEAHGGTLAVAPAVPHGTVFTFELPTTRPTAATGPTRVRTQMRRRG